jgi:hypothetical protein
MFCELYVFCELYMPFSKKLIRAFIVEFGSNVQSSKPSKLDRCGHKYTEIHKCLCMTCMVLKNQNIRKKHTTNDPSAES